MKRTLTNATVLALALIATPVLAQYSQQQTTPTPTDQTTTQPTNESTAPNPNNTNPSDAASPAGPTGTTQSTTMDNAATSPSTTTTTTDESLPATGSPMSSVIAVSLAAMAIGAWLSRPRTRA